MKMSDIHKIKFRLYEEDESEIISKSSESQKNKEKENTDGEIMSESESEVSQFSLLIARGKLYPSKRV